MEPNGGVPPRTHQKLVGGLLHPTPLGKEFINPSGHTVRRRLDILNLNSRRFALFLTFSCQNVPCIAMISFKSITLPYLLGSQP